MATKRVFKVKTFARWAKHVLTDAQLFAAAMEIMQGRYEADLGAGICKKRIAKAGQGKRGAVRALVVLHSVQAIFYLVGREKSDPGSDFSTADVAAAKIIGSALQAASTAQLEALVADGLLKEILDEDCK